MVLMSSLQIYLNNLMGMIIKCLNKTIQIKENNFYEMESYLRGKVSVAVLVPSKQQNPQWYY